jgi:hypothetical protein
LVFIADFKAQLTGKLYGVLQWQQLDALWAQLNLFHLTQCQTAVHAVAGGLTDFDVFGVCDLF